jgi:hypothetical protein
MKIGSRQWLRKYAPVSQFENTNTVGSTAWLDLRAKRDRQRQWLNDIPKPPKGPRIYRAEDEDHSEPMDDASEYDVSVD